MRRLTLAAFSAALVLSACSDQSPTEPEIPPPAESFGTTCTVTRFPLPLALTQIKTVFPTPRLKLEASLRAGAIALLWNTCHEKLAQRAALEFVKWMGRQTLPTTDAAKQAQTDLIVTILSGVGLLDLPPNTSGGDDFGIGLYDPTKTTPQVFETNGGTALTELLFGAFSEFTVIVISRRPDDSDPLDFDGNQFPPFFDYNAINASGNHFFENGETATIAFCQLPETEGFEYPELADIKIGHNKPTDPVEFELLDAEAVREELAARLNCDALETAFADFGILQNLARATGRSLAPIARAIFMPAPLQAATTAVGYLGPISTKPGSFSPFGIVEFTEGEVIGFGTELGSDNSGRHFPGQVLRVCSDGCFFPKFRISDGEGTLTTPTQLSVELLPGESSTGTLGGDLTQTTSATSPWAATFDDLTISGPGSYQLIVSALGVAPHTTASFVVTPTGLVLVPDGLPPSDPENGPPPPIFQPGSILSWTDFGCEIECVVRFPTVKLVAADVEDGEAVGGVPISVRLVRFTNDAVEEFRGGSVTTVTTTEDGYAVFDNLRISTEGLFVIGFDAPGGGGLASGGIEVVDATSTTSTRTLPSMISQ